jgi:hypothetical protein
MHQQYHQSPSPLQQQQQQQQYQQPYYSPHVMPQQNYGMYQQQVPIAPQPTGSTFASPQSPPPPFQAVPVQQPLEKGAGVAYGQDVPGDPNRIPLQELPGSSR